VALRLHQRLRTRLARILLQDVAKPIPTLAQHSSHWRQDSPAYSNFPTISLVVCLILRARRLVVRTAGTVPCSRFNFDNGPAATSQSYDLSNIQGFTRGMQAVPWPSDAGCQTKTCWAADCDLSQAYPPGNEGDNAANTSCGAANLGITLYLCAA